METLKVKMVSQQYSFSQFCAMFHFFSYCAFHMNTEVLNQSENPCSVVRNFHVPSCRFLRCVQIAMKLIRLPRNDY